MGGRRVSATALLFAGSAVGVVGGLALRAAGASRESDVVWALTAAAALLPATWEVVAGLRRRQTGVDLVAVLALAGSLAVGELLAGAIIALMLASGRELERRAAARARRDLSALLARAPRTAHVRVGDTLTDVPLDQVQVGDHLLVRPGEVVPVDGLLAEPAVLDESALTGEPLPVERHPREPVRSGVVNAGGAFGLTAVTPAAQSTYAGIVRLVEQAQASSAPFVRLADRYAGVFLPTTLLVAGVAWLLSGDPVRAVAVLVVATPCPLLLAAPVAVVSGLSRCARRGIVVKGGAALEALAGAQVLLFDKTGTLTAGRPTVTEVVAQALPADEVLTCAAAVERLSPHVLAAAVVHAADERGLPLPPAFSVTERPGWGVSGRVDGRVVEVGRGRWLVPEPAPGWVRSLRRRAALDGRVTVFVRVDGDLVGALLLHDPVRPDAARMVRALRRAGIRRTVMVTGDRVDVAETVGAAIGADVVLAERLPEEKLDAVHAARAAGTTVMVGDGINDAPALAAADVGVAIGARGATASSEAADVVLTVDRLDRLAEAIQVARRARGIARQSALAGMLLSLLAMGVAAAGALPPAAGALLQEGIDVAVILNALRAVRPPRSVEPRLAGPPAELTRRLQAEHVGLRDQVEELRVLGDRLADPADPLAAVAAVRAAYDRLVTDLLPHELAEETELYPALDEVLGGEDPTGVMSRGHAEIEHLVRRLGRLLADLGAEAPDEEDRIELQAALYGLHAVLRLHFAQEEEEFFTLLDEEAPAAAR